MQNPEVSNADVLTLRQFVSKLPVFLSGIPDRAKGLYIANRKSGNKSVGLGVCLEKATKRNPKGTALIYGERELSYQQFNAWVNRYADSLARMGTNKGDVVAIFIENRPELLACIAAVAKVGGVSALLNTSQRGKVLEHSIQLVKPSRMIVGEELFSSVMDVESVIPKEESARLYLSDCDTLSDQTSAPKGWTDFAEQARSGYSKNPKSSQDQRATEPFCYFYTSGTTGLPKAAILTHGRFMKAYGGVGLAGIQLKPSDRAFVTLPFYHGTALIIGWGSVLAGAAGLVMARQFSASQFWPEVRRTGVTAFCYVGELCRYLLAQAPSTQDQNHHVRMMFGNGLRPNLWQEFKSRFNVPKVMEFYGSSEGNIGFMNVFNHDCTVGFTTIPYAIVEYDLDLDDVVQVVMVELLIEIDFAIDIGLPIAKIERVLGHATVANCHPDGILFWRRAAIISARPVYGDDAVEIHNPTSPSIKLAMVVVSFRSNTGRLLSMAVSLAIARIVGSFLAMSALFGWARNASILGWASRLYPSMRTRSTGASCKSRSASGGSGASRNSVISAQRDLEASNTCCAPAVRWR